MVARSSAARAIAKAGSATSGPKRSRVVRENGTCAAGSAAQPYGYARQLSGCLNGNDRPWSMATRLSRGAATCSHTPSSAPEPSADDGGGTGTGTCVGICAGIGVGSSSSAILTSQLSFPRSACTRPTSTRVRMLLCRCISLPVWLTRTARAQTHILCPRSHTRAPHARTPTHTYAQHMLTQKTLSLSLPLSRSLSVSLSLSLSLSLNQPRALPPSRMLSLWVYTAYPCCE
jgi:hypothetical protein